MNIKISPSILSADFGNLKKDIELLNNTDVDYLHIDVMDGNFVPNISFGQPILKHIKKYSKKPLDTHLMIKNPELYIKDFIELGSDIITFHIESTIHADRLIDQIKSYGVKVGIALNPSTHHSSIEYLIKKLDLILIMTVNPGFGGQKFIDNQIKKIQEIKKLSQIINPNILISVDGGVDNLNSKQIIDAGANMLVAGSYIFSESYKLDDYQNKVSSLRNSKNTNNDLFAQSKIMTNANYVEKY